MILWLLLWQQPAQVLTRDTGGPCFLQEGITIADATSPDMPLIYVNEGFEKITGYPIDYALGRNW